MDRGSLGGVTANTWVNYTPQLWCAANGSVTHPTGGAGQGSRGRYILLPGLVIAQFQINRGITSNTGTGDCYVVDLPIPAARNLDGPIVIGQALPYRTLSSNPWEVAAIVTVADEWTSLGGAGNRYAQFYIPWIVAAGTGTWTASTASTTVTHSLGYAPNAADINFVMTSGTSVALGTWGVMIQNITTTTFDAVEQGAASLATVDNSYEWSIRTEPTSGTAGSWLLGPNRPWIPTIESLIPQVYYEPA